MTPEQRQAHKRLLARLPVRTCQELTAYEKKRNTTITPEMFAEMKAMESRGMTRFSISLQFGIASATVSRWLGSKK